MTTSTRPSLGVLELERGLPPGTELVAQRLPGSLINPATFDFPIVLETVEGAWADVAVAGNPALESACIAAARRLVQRGAVAISANCGFFIRHQAAVAAAVNVPVAMSSLLLIPTLLRDLPPAAKIALVTADSKNLGRDLLGVKDPGDQARIVIGGIEGGKYYKQAMQRPLPPPDLAAIESDVAGCIERLRAAHPEIAAILFECTAFPMVAASIRRMTNLPIHDITSFCRLMIASVRLS
ncbi:aspartate/glutamate racemase family protein [Bradyrhizobium sp. 195]|uniref:hypothetical protein n=1 Tax=Bradyrhizobium sp. 195 TaxID=2782662 RepID=UPI0020019DFA|nr:hypothetical protein [Bradyrhizobium sp. 195]UPK28231.1 hypothetical protein IVB26_07010 [Bradyrhizobium sp. 195]